MKSFHAFWDQVNGKMYENVPPPVKYDMGNYMDMTTSPLNGSEEGSTWALRPLTRDDTASHAADDVLDWQKKHGRNTTKLGDPMSDAEFAKFHGMTWGVGLLPGISTGR